jgi:hypothetical protein
LQGRRPCPPPPERGRLEEGFLRVRCEDGRAEKLIEEPQVIAKILAHLEKSAPAQPQPELPLGARVLPSQGRRRSRTIPAVNPARSRRRSS